MLIAAALTAYNAVLPEPAAPALLLGVGEAGRRVAAGVAARLERDPVRQRGGVLLVSEETGAGLRDALRKTIYELERQATIRRVEPGHAIRVPPFRFLKLHLVCAACLGEVGADALREVMQVVRRIKHPGAGLELLFVLDLTDSQDPDGVAPNALASLYALQSEAEALSVAGQAAWGVAPRIRFLVAHPHRADGSRLGKGEQESAGKERGTGRAELDEFEAVLAGAMAAHVAVGPFQDALAPRFGDDVAGDAAPFAAFGWAGGRFPREELLARAAQFLGADLLARTEQPEAGSKSAESLLAGEAGGAWEAWRTTRDDVLLNRGALVRRVLLSSGSNRIELREETPPPARRSWYQRMVAKSFGDREAPRNGPGLAVRMALSNHLWRGADTRGWPEEIKKRDEAGEGVLEEQIASLDKANAKPKITDEVTSALRRCVDLCVTRHLGGTEAARRLLDEAAQQTQAGIGQGGQPPFGEPHAPDELGLPDNAGLESAQKVFEERCHLLPGWPAALSRGCAFGALWTTGCLALGGWLSLAYLGGGGIALASFAYYGWHLGRLKRLGDYVTECLRAKYGRKLWEYAQQAVGMADHPGIYSAVENWITASERPAVEAFETARERTVASARENPPFPTVEGEAELLADAEDASSLYALVRRGIDDGALSDAARDALQIQNLFGSWRDPDMVKISAWVSGQMRAKRLTDWERNRKPLGDWVQELLRLEVENGAVVSVFRAWVRQRMDGLAMQSIPLALRLAPHSDRADGERDQSSQTSILVAAPASLRWAEAQASAHNGDAALQPVVSSASDAGAPPSGSAAADLAAWFGASGAACRVLEQESDTLACLVLVSGLTADDAVYALGQDDAARPENRSERLGETVKRNGDWRDAPSASVLGSNGNPPASVGIYEAPALPVAVAVGNGHAKADANGSVPAPGFRTPDAERPEENV